MGIDSINIDSAADPQRPAHTLLLAAGIPWWSTSRASTGCPRPDSGCTRARVPAPVTGMGTFPVGRAYAILVELS